jgi:hypothetical protein
LLLEGGRQHAIVEVATVDDDVLHAAHAQLHQLARHRQQIAEVERRIALAAQDQRVDAALRIDRARQRGAQAILRAELYECAGSRDELHVGGGIAWCFAAQRVDSLSRGRIRHHRSDRSAQFGVVDQASDSFRELAGILGAARLAGCEPEPRHE